MNNPAKRLEVGGIPYRTPLAATRTLFGSSLPCPDTRQLAACPECRRTLSGRVADVDYKRSADCTQRLIQRVQPEFVIGIQGKPARA